MRKLDPSIAITPEGASNGGIGQATFRALGFGHTVLMATPEELAAAYRLLWEQPRLYDPEAYCKRGVFELLPEPADTVAFQFYVTISATAFVRCLQHSMAAPTDGILGAPLYFVLKAQAGRGKALGERLLTTQEVFYLAHPDYAERGMQARVEQVRAWLAQ